MRAVMVGGIAEAESDFRTSFWFHALRETLSNLISEPYSSLKSNPAVVAPRLMGFSTEPKSGKKSPVISGRTHIISSQQIY